MSNDNIVASPPPITVLTIKDMIVKYDLHKTTVREMIRQNYFPHAYREGKGQCARWLIPIADLEGFSPRRKGAPRRSVSPKTLAVRSRGKYARSRIKRLYGYGRTEIDEMLRLAKERVSREEIAIRFRISRRFVDDILDEIAVRRYQQRKSAPVLRDWRKIPNDLLRDLYIEGKFSIPYIIDKLHSNQTTLYISLKQYGLPLRNEDFRLSARENQQIFRQLLIDEGLAPATVAARLKLTIEYVKLKLKEINTSA